MPTYVSNYKDYAKFTKREWKEITITVLVIAIIVGFNDKRPNSSIDAYYFGYLFMAFIITAIAMFVHEFGHRALAIYRGVKAEYHYSPFGLFYGFLFSLASNGSIWLLTPGYTMPIFEDFLRVGKFRYQFGRKEYAWVMAAGPLANVILALILKTVNLSNNPFLDLAVKVNLAIAIFSLLPIPQEDGIYVWSGQRWFYYFVVFSAIGALIAVFLVTNFFLLLGMTIVIGAAGAILIVQQIEKS